MVFDDAPDIPPDYVFDMNMDVDANDSFSQRPTGTIGSQNNRNDDLPFTNGTIHQDFNNNDGISFNDVEFDNGNDDNNNNNNINNNINKRIQLLKGEYAYHFGNIRNFWAGPSYWKFSKNLNHQNHQAPAEADKRGNRRKTKRPNKPKFDDGSDYSSDDECFIKIKSKAAKKVRCCNRSLWSSEKLKLPAQCNIPKDLFDKYDYNGQSNTSTDSLESNREDNYDADGIDFGVSSFSYFTLAQFMISHNLFYGFSGNISQFTE